jgi:tetratricopeptide (TPR) repeat protein
MSKWPQPTFAHVQQDKCDRKLNTRWQRKLHVIMEKSAEPQLYLNNVENLNDSHPDWPFALVRLGKAYLLLQDLHGALAQFEKALSLLSPLQDNKFAQYVEGLRAYITVTKSPFVISLLDRSHSVRTLRAKKVSSFEYCLCDVTETIFR